jgi:hypothetical protein
VFNEGGENAMGGRRGESSFCRGFPQLRLTKTGYCLDDVDQLAKRSHVCSVLWNGILEYGTQNTMAARMPSRCFGFSWAKRREEVSDPRRRKSGVKKGRSFSFRGK